ncbi:hypothetical protein BX666DRAFT_2023518 [Dichotomocladium elegans]|nr:hypothetical protein BX666DRAFT_2023518 [Dichotomocladium elegans]
MNLAQLAHGPTETLNVVRKIMNKEYKEERISSPEQDFILFLIYCIVMRAKDVGERRFRLYIGNGNWVTLPQHVSDDLQTIYRNGLPVQYTLGPGLSLDILPNDMDCNSRTACLPGLMRVDLCYSNRSDTEVSQQALARYVKQLLESQGTMDAFPPPAAMRCTKEHLAENEDIKEEQETGDILTMPHVLSLPSHRHLSLVPPLPPSVPNRRRVTSTLSPYRCAAEAHDETLSVSPFSRLRKRRTTLPHSQTKRRLFHSPTTQRLTTYGTGPSVPPTTLDRFYHVKNGESPRLFSRCGGSSSNSSINSDNMANVNQSDTPTVVWPYRSQAATEMMQCNEIELPVDYLPRHHAHPLTPVEHPYVATAPRSSSTPMATTFSYPLSDLSSSPESVVMHHSNMNAEMETQQQSSIDSYQSIIQYFFVKAREGASDEWIETDVEKFEGGGIIAERISSTYGQGHVVDERGCFEPMDYAIDEEMYSLQSVCSHTEYLRSILCKDNPELNPTRIPQRKDTDIRMIEAGIKRSLHIRSAQRWALQYEKDPDSIFKKPNTGDRSRVLNEEHKRTVLECVDEDPSIALE